MVNEQQSVSGVRFFELVPMLVVILVAAHVLALVYWIYRLASDKQPQRRKAH